MRVQIIRLFILLFTAGQKVSATLIVATAWIHSYTADGGMDKTSSRQEEGSSAEGGGAHTETLDNGARIKPWKLY